MRVATFNTLHGAPPGGPADMAAFGRACASLDADLLALQEVELRTRRVAHRDMVEVAAAATGLSAVFGPAVRMRRRGRYGNALLVGGRTSAVEVVALPRPRMGEPRSCILALAELASGEAVSVAATHLSVDGAESPEQLDVVLAALARRPRPRMLLGDLNLRPEVAVPILEDAGYIVADPTIATYPVGDPRIRIDYIAADGLEVRAVTARSLEVSDHLALVGEVEPSP